MDRLAEEIGDRRSRFRLFGGFVVVWTLVSRIPLPKRFWPEVMPEGNRALSLAPLAGGLMGLLAGFIVSSAVILGIKPLGAAWIGVFFYTLAGWSLHLDGWGDLWDGIGSGKRGDELRSVMKDSRLGAYGAVGLILAVGLWASFVGTIRLEELPAACLISAAAGRLACCSAAYRGEYPWPSGMGKGWVDTFESYDLFTAILLFLLFVPLSPVRGAACAAISLAVGFAVAGRMNLKLGGVNGDVLGAAAVAAELLSLAVFSL